MNYRDNNFHDDLKIGHIYEKKVLEMVQLQYPDAYMVEGYFKKGDIHIPSIDEYVEVKSDQKSKYTGNLVIEIEFNGKPSALSTTKSYRWVFYTGEEYIITSPERIREVVKDMRPAKFTGKGDTKPKLAYLVKKQLIMRNAILVKPLERG
jgi:hypothetical protein